MSGGFFANGHANEAVVATGFPVLALFALDGGNQSHPDQAAGDQRLLIEDENVQGIAVVAFGRRDEPEVEWENHAFGQGSFQLKQPDFWVVGVFDAAAFGSFDYDIEAASAIESIKALNQVFHGRLVDEWQLNAPRRDTSEGRLSQTSLL